jgi:hypothetical protein
MPEDIFEDAFALGYYLGENSKPFLSALKDGVFRNTGLTMVMLHGDPLMRRVTEIIGRVVEAGLYNYRKTQRMYAMKLIFQKVYNVHPINEYYSFNLHHMQPAFYFLLFGWCLSALCFVFEILYSRVLSKRK